jgi:transposase
VGIKRHSSVTALAGSVAFTLKGAEQQRIKALEREVKELRKANEILKLASAFFAQAELDRRFKS